MKKSVAILLVFLLVFNLAFILADEEQDPEDETNGDDNGEDDSVQVNEDDSDRAKTLKAYNCFRDKINNKCNTLGVDDLIFSSWITAECKDEFLAESNNQECWPSSCNVKKTAQAIIALDQLSEDTEKAKDWLLTKTTFPQEMVWYLQIESNKATTCSITYEGTTKPISIGEDKKINSNAGPCLTLAQGNYWLKVSPNCYDKEFQISCNEDFLTNLLYKKVTSSTIYVPETVQIASAEGTTTEKINSRCFSDSTACDYEASLWATLALDRIGEDTEMFIPYLTAMQESNEEFLPSSFLYLLTNFPDFYVTLSSSQAGTKYWDLSGDKFYDTGVALLGLQAKDTSEKQNTINWLFEIQDDDGCWRTTIKNTALLLYSAFPREIETPVADDTCENAGNYCVGSSILCKQADGEIFRGYSCPGIKVCCSVPEKVETCKDLGGTVCKENERCDGNKLPDTEDLSYGETCCQGQCKVAPVVQEPECEEKNIGFCRTNCFEGEEINSAYGCDGTEVCCKKTTSSGGFSWIWIIILIILIILVVLAIIFRDKLRPFWMRIKSKFSRGKGKSSGPSNRPGPRPGMPPPGFPRQKIMPRRFPPRRPSTLPQKPPIKKKTNDELSNVLNKLKEMGN